MLLVQVEDGGYLVTTDGIAILLIVRFPTIRIGATQNLPKTCVSLHRSFASGHSSLIPTPSATHWPCQNSLREHDAIRAYQKVMMLLKDTRPEIKWRGPGRRRGFNNERQLHLLSFRPVATFMICQHGRSVHEALPHLWGNGDSHFSSHFIPT